MWLELDGEGPLYRQTYRALRARILEGVLTPGSRLPATRDLARELGLSRNTVVEAYRQLVDEGYAQSRVGDGTRVATALPEARTTIDRRPGAEHAPVAAAAPRFSREARRSLDTAPRAGLSWALPRRNLEYDFRYGEPAYGDLPLATWQRLVGRHLRLASARRLAYTPPGGAPELRRALADYLGRARGVRCDPEQVLVTHGTQQAIDLVARLLVEPDDRVALEEPHYSGVSLRMAAAGARLVPIPVDESGLVVERLEREEEVVLVCATPSHQFPTGAILPLDRRAALLAWAERSNAFILEDDYDSEFRYDGRPIECLQGLDRSGRVLYTGSVSKLLFPSLRIGWLVLPTPLVRAFETAKVLADTGTATLEQLALASLVDEGGLERHVRRMRVRNGERRAALLEALASELGDDARVGGANAGLHVLLELPQVAAEQAGALRRRCEARSVGLYPAAPYYLDPPAHASFVLGYASMDETRIREGVKRMAAALREPGPR